MPTNVTLIYPDCDMSGDGLLYLPGDPVNVSDGESCTLCGDDLDSAELDGHVPATATGAHRGIVTTDEGASERPDTGQWREVMHLRCLIDCGREYGSVGLLIGATSLPDSGRHHGVTDYGQAVR